MALKGWIKLISSIVALIAIAATYSYWQPLAARLWSAAGQPQMLAEATDDHGHDHDHAGHDEGNSLELTPQGLKNIGYRPFTVELGSFERSISVPAMVVERPGRSLIQITAPLTGVVTRIHVIEGEAIEPESPLFDIRLTHEDLVNAQRDYLRTLGELDVTEREVRRLESVGAGVIAGKRVLEVKYEAEKLAAVLNAEHQGLLLHGLNEQQVQQIRTTRQLLPKLTIYAPPHEDDTEHCPQDHLYHIQLLAVQQGQQVTAGESLCRLADHCELYIEGNAFEDDAELLRQAAEQHWKVTAWMLSGSSKGKPIKGLELMYLSDRVELDSRSFHFYLRLTNEVVLDRKQGSHRFLQWRYKPGQRMELEVPVERWDRRFVLPVDSVVDEGAENYVFQQNVDHFDRVPVHVEYRDQRWAVVANDGKLFPGDVIAGHGAYQMQLEMKNQSGGAIDPHAGHNH